MDFNTILIKFGLESSNFTNKLLDVVQNGDDFFMWWRKHIKNQYVLIAITSIYSYMGVDGWKSNLIQALNQEKY